MIRRFGATLLFGTALACGGGGVEDLTDPAVNAFVEGEDFAVAANDGKEDTGFLSSLDAREVEMTIEADVEATTWSLDRAPLEVGQFALTYFRQTQDIYIQSLAEDYAAGDKQIEWKVGEAWKTWGSMTSSEQSGAKHFRLTRVNAVILDASSRGLKEGKSFQATVPLKPGTLMQDVGNKCAHEGHITASADVYWYVWAPDQAGCKAKVQQAVATITTLLPKGKTVYPDYDKLFKDKTLDVIVFFGQVDDEYSENDYAFDAIANFEASLKTAGFKKGTAAKGARWTRVKSGITANVDIYSPKEFRGLTDYANVQNFYDGVASHQLIVWNGHSVLGASDFWSNPQIYKDPSKYQIFLYNGCLGYEYYVTPILAGKQSSANVDLVSNVIETPFHIMVQETSTAISMMIAKAEKGGASSWQSILGKMNKIAGGDSFYGVSAARDNTYRPPGK